MRTSRLLTAMLAAFLSFQIAACATSGTVLSESAGTLRTGLSAAREQADLTFREANAQARERAVARMLASPDLQLTEEQFHDAVSRPSIERWQNTFGILDQYLAALQQLVDPARARDTSAQLTALGTRLQSGAISAELPDGLTSVVARLGGAIVQAASERRAQTIMARTDPDFRATLEAMAHAVDPARGVGIPATVRNTWTFQMDEVHAAYSAAPQTQRAALITRFLELARKRDDQMLRFERLKSSLLSLAEAHSAAARGNGSEALLWIGRIDLLLRQIRTDLGGTQ
jgi:hypothetical protein